MTTTDLLAGSPVRVTSSVAVHANNIQEMLVLQDRSCKADKPPERIGPFEAKYTLSDSQRALLTSLAPYYTPTRLRELVLPLLQQNSPVSLRALDWLVTNYSKKHNVVCRTPRGEHFNIHHSYRNALSMNKRRNFDPFRRRLRIAVHLGEGSAEAEPTSFESTVGQLNFIHWANENGVIDYLRENASEITRDVSRTAHTSKAARAPQEAESSEQHPHTAAESEAPAHSKRRSGERLESKTRKKRTELSKAPSTKCVVYKEG